MSESVLMDDAEILRRLRAILATPRTERVVSLRTISQISGLKGQSIYAIINSTSGRLYQPVRVKMTYALRLIENNQVKITRFGRCNLEKRVEIVDRKPIQQNIPKIIMGINGPQIRYDAVNPLTFPPELQGKPLQRKA